MLHQYSVMHTSLMGAVTRGIKFRPAHVRRYLGLGLVQFDRLLDRAGLGNEKSARTLATRQVRQVIAYYYVMLGEKKAGRQKARHPMLKRTQRTSRNSSGRFERGW